jgi:hypothetical protein
MQAMTKGRLMRWAVRFAELAGWLTLVDGGVVRAYLGSHEKGLDSAVAKKFDNSEFIRSGWCEYAFWCVEVAHENGMVAVRNSADKQKTTVYFTVDEWRTFVKGVKCGEFDF